MRTHLALSVLMLGLPLFASGESRDLSALNWEVEEVSLSQKIRIEADPKAPEKREFLYWDGQQKVELNLDFKGVEKEMSAWNQLSETEKSQFHQARRDMLVATARMLSEERLYNISLVGTEKAIHLVPNEERLDELSLKPLSPLDQSLDVKKSPGKAKVFFQFLNEAIVLSTYKAARHHWENRQYLKGLTNEFGIQITLKAEFQFGMGRYNIVKNLPIVLSLGYRKSTREVLIRVAKRVEAMNSGTALSAGVKVEVRKYQSISNPTGSVKVEGVSWYPPGLPMFSAVADAGLNYRSLGLVFGLNFADLLPGMYFINTVNDFSDKELYVRSIRMPSLKGWLNHASEVLKRKAGATTVVAPVACRAVFSL